jgi:TonB family protein
MGSNYERGLALYQTKQFKNAEKEFRQELAQNPNSASAHAMLGMTLTALRKGDQGHKEALEAVRLLPGYSYGHYTLSFTFTAMNKGKEAEKAIIEAIRLDPEEAYLFARASQIYFGQKKYPRALEMADLGLACDPEHEECLINRGACLLELNRLPEAEEAIAQALAIAPESSTAHINQGAVQLRMLNHVQAFEHYREALRLNPASDQARLGVVESLKAKNRLYHGLLRFSIWCRTLPPWAVAACLLLLVVPYTRFAIIALLGLYAFTNYLFELALHLDPVGRTFLGQKQKENFAALKSASIPFLVVFIMFCISLGAAMGPVHNHKHRRAAVVDEPVDSMKFKDYQSYMVYIEKRIRRHWQPPDMNQSNRARTQFTIDREGKISNARVIKSSGDDQVDKAAVAAIQEAAPLPKLPPTKDKSVEVQFNFAYNVHVDSGTKAKPVDPVSKSNQNAVSTKGKQVDEESKSNQDAVSTKQIKPIR